MSCLPRIEGHSPHHPCYGVLILNPPMERLYFTPRWSAYSLPLDGALTGLMIPTLVRCGLLADQELMVQALRHRWLHQDQEGGQGLRRGLGGGCGCSGQDPCESRG
jgi:hypothetical protein